MNDLVIVGAGGFGREMYHWARAAIAADQFKVKGFLSSSRDDLEGFAIDAPVLGDPEDYQPLPGERYLFAIGRIEVKRRIIETLRKKGAQFLSLIHPSAIVAQTAQIGEGVVICPFVTVSDHVKLDEFTMLNFYSSCGHDAHVGPYSILSPYATLNGFATIEHEVFLGTHATVTPSQRVGHHSKVSANSVVTHDVRPYTLVYGVPGRHQKLMQQRDDG